MHHWHILLYGAFGDKLVDSLQIESIHQSTESGLSACASWVYQTR
jgi:hypothetical protein